MSVNPEHRIAMVLTSMGIAVTGIEPWDDQTDASVNLTDGVNVQVGYGYLIVNKVVEAPEWTMYHWPNRKPADLAGVITDVRAALSGALPC